MNLPAYWLTVAVIVALGLLTPTAKEPAPLLLIPLGQLKGCEPTDALYRPSPMDRGSDGEA